MHLQAVGAAPLGDSNSGENPEDPPTEGEAPAASTRAAEIPDDLTSLSLEELTNLSVEEVSGAAKHAQRVTEAPSSVTIVTADEIRKLGYRQFNEILQGVRGFYVTYDRTYNYLGVRGFNRLGDYNSRVLLLVNGLRLNDSLYDAAPVGADFPIDIDLIDRVEIIRGPGSAIYGSNAFFAVVNVITKSGASLDSVETSVRAGSFESYKGRVSVGKKLENGIDFLVSATGWSSRGQTFFFKEYNDPTTHNGISRDRDRESSYALFGQFQIHDFRLQTGYGSRSKEVPTGAFADIFDDPDNGVLDDHAFVDLTFERALTPAWTLLARAFYSYYYYHGKYAIDLSGTGGPSRVLNEDIGRTSLWGSEIMASTDWIPANKVTFGGELNHAFQQDQRNFDVRENLNDQRNTLRFGVYLQDEISIWESLVLSAGVRYDHYEGIGDAVNPRLAVICTPLDKTTFKFLYGSAFRAPNAYERFYGDGGSTQKGNSNLDPEKIESYELVLEQYLGTHARFIASAYHFEIRDLINQETDPTDGLLVFQNTQRSDANGIELEAEVKWSAGYKAKVSYTAQESRFRHPSSHLTNSPEHMLKASLVIPILEQRAFAGIEGQYTSRRRTLAGEFAQDHFLLNFTLFGPEILKGLDVSASIYNVLDQKYEDPVHDGHRQDTIVQDGRTFSFQITYRFW